MVRQEVAASASILLLMADGEEGTERVRLLDRELEIRRINCRRNLQTVGDLIDSHDGEFDAIGLEGFPLVLRLDQAQVNHTLTAFLRDAARKTPVVDGSGIRPGLERWGVVLAQRAEPGIFAEKRVLMMPGLNHVGLASSLARHGCQVRYADPVIFFDLPQFPGVARKTTLEQAAEPILQTLRADPLERLFPPPEPRRGHGHHGLVEWADLLAGDAATIRCFSPADLRGKTVVVERASREDEMDLTARGASILVAMMPELETDGARYPASAAAIEAAMVALRDHPDLSLSEDTYLDQIASLDWSPRISYLQPGEADVNRFAFVIHPLSVRMIKAHPKFRWARALPDRLVEWFASYLPPLYVSTVTGAVSPRTGQRVEGFLYTLGATPRRMMQQGVRYTYDKLLEIARGAQRRGARIMGLGAFTSVVGDAGKTVAHEADIAITSGNSLTVAATLEAAKEAVLKMGATDLTRGRAMIIGATGSIGAVCARLIAQAIRDVVLISIEPERLIELKRRIQQETPGARVVIGTRPGDHLADCDLVVTATSAFGQRVLDISGCKPGAVVCDVARPHDLSPEEAAARPDVLVIDSGEVLIPGDIDFGYDIGLPPGVAYACLAETCLLAMAGRFEDFTIGRELSMERVKEIYRLFQAHGFRIAGLHSFDETVTEEQLAEKRRLAERLRGDPVLLETTMREAARKIASVPVAAKGVRPSRQAPWLPQSWLTHLFEFLDRRVAPPH
jgi:predicted amino acid dehydrogenase